MIQRRTPLKRSAPPRKRRPGTRRGQPTKEEKGRIRLAVYERAQGRCELRLHKDCSGERVLPWGGDVFHRAHLVHLHGKRRFGWTEADGNTLLIGCYWCHIVSQHSQGIAIVPPKRDAE